MHHPDPIPVSTTKHLRRQADKEATIDEAYDSLKPSMIFAMRDHAERNINASL